MTPEHIAYEATPEFQACLSTYEKTLAIEHNYVAELQRTFKRDAVAARYDVTRNRSTPELDRLRTALDECADTTAVQLRACRATPEHKAAFGW